MRGIQHFISEELAPACAGDDSGAGAMTVEIGDGSEDGAMALQTAR
jgi:hypothetical protein